MFHRAIYNNNSLYSSSSFTIDLMECPDDNDHDQDNCNCPHVLRNKIDAVIDRDIIQENNRRPCISPSLL